MIIQGRILKEKSMKNLKNNQCLAPKCHKEVYKPGAKFCLEHKRVAGEWVDTGKKLGLTAAGLAGTFVVGAAGNFIKSKSGK